MPILKAVNSKASFGTAINYVLRKAEAVEALNCRPETVEEEMNITRRFYNKNDGRIFYHYVLSFSPEDNVSAKDCLKITEEVIKANPLLKGHEILLCAHTDRAHTHAHIIINSVRQTDGKKFHISKKQYNSWIKKQQAICKSFGYEPVKKEKKERGEVRSNNRTKYETIRRQGREADIGFVYHSINQARETSRDWDSFKIFLEKKGISIIDKESRKHLVFSFHNRRFRDSNISKTFSDHITKESLNYEFQQNRRSKRSAEISRTVEQRKRQLDQFTQGISVPNSGTESKFTRCLRRQSKS